MNLKKIALITLLSVLSGAFHAAAGETSRQVITVTTTVPSKTFYVQPVSGNWPTKIDLHYDSVTPGLDTYELSLSSKYGSGLKAMLLNTPMLRSGNDTIPLTVTLGSTPLSTTPAVIANSPGDKVPYILKITGTIAQGATVQPGQYQGTINILFEDAI